MCNAVLEGERAIVDLAKCPYEFASPEFINLHLKDIASTDKPISTIRYEEERIIDLNEESTAVIVEYATLLRQLEGLLLKKEIYGMKEDPKYSERREVMRKLYEELFRDPITAIREFESYQEPIPLKSVFLEGRKRFLAWKNGIVKRFKKSRMYKLVEKYGDMRKAFLSLVGLKTLYFVDALVLDIPKNAKEVREKDASYVLPYGVKVQIYEIPEEESYLYVQRNEVVEKLPEHLAKMMKATISDHISERFESTKNFEMLYLLKWREYKQYYLEKCLEDGLDITPVQANIMGRETANWTVGMGSPLENLALDKKNLTDIYIDAENSPIYVEHKEYGICHTLYRYNRELLEHAFKNIVLSSKGTQFDEGNPIADLVLKRHMMRCHLQRPPATFEELQGALRIMKESPFTYAQYIAYRSMSPFLAGYDDVMVSLGCSEAVLGLKGVGKTSFTAAKIASIGTAKRIIPIQDIEEIPVRAFRKRGFHIGIARVKSAEEINPSDSKRFYDLVTMANALLRMGDAAIIINEVRSKSAVQGIINLLNTQPGVFLLYNLHAESLKDIQDRLELVFGIPAASMFATDRYSFLKKIKFGRKGKIHRLLGNVYETDMNNHRFVEVFRFLRKGKIEECIFSPRFIKNPEVSKNSFEKMDLRRMEVEGLDLAFMPPALFRRSEESGIAPEQYIFQAIYKGMVFDDIRRASEKRDDPILLELDFFMKCNTKANRIMTSLEAENGSVDWGEAQKRWRMEFPNILRSEYVQRRR